MGKLAIASLAFILSFAAAVSRAEERSKGFFRPPSSEGKQRSGEENDRKSDRDYDPGRDSSFRKSFFGPDPSVEEKQRIVDEIERRSQRDSTPARDSFEFDRGRGEDRTLRMREPDSQGHQGFFRSAESQTQRPSGIRVHGSGSFTVISNGDGPSILLDTRNGQTWRLVSKDGGMDWVEIKKRANSRERATTAPEGKLSNSGEKPLEQGAEIERLILAIKVQSEEIIELREELAEAKEKLEKPARPSMEVVAPERMASELRDK